MCTSFNRNVLRSDRLHSSSISLLRRQSVCTPSTFEWSVETTLPSASSSTLLSQGVDHSMTLKPISTIIIKFVIISRSFSGPKVHSSRPSPSNYLQWYIYNCLTYLPSSLSQGYKFFSYVSDELFQYNLSCILTTERRPVRELVDQSPFDRLPEQERVREVRGEGWGWVRSEYGKGLLLRVRRRE